MTEIWKDIPGYEGYYQVSNKGNVWSVPRKGIRNRSHGGHLMSLTLQRDGYNRIELNKAGKPKKWGLHQLVAAAFIGVCPDGHAVNHKDGNKTNNTPDNLEYMTHSENNVHSRQVLGKCRGNNHWKSILSEKDVLEMKALRKRGLAYRKIAIKYSVGTSTAHAAINGQNWRWIK